MMIARLAEIYGNELMIEIAEKIENSCYYRLVVTLGFMALQR